MEVLYYKSSYLTLPNVGILTHAPFTLFYSWSYA